LKFLSQAVTLQGVSFGHVDDSQQIPMKSTGRFAGPEKHPIARSPIAIATDRAITDRADRDRRDDRAIRAAKHDAH